MATELAASYEKLQKKYGLPDFGELDREFEISTIDEENFLLREIRRKINDRIKLFCEVLERIMQPDQNMADLHEVKEFSYAEIADLFILYRKLMSSGRDALISGIERNEKRDAQFINDFYKEYPEIKKSMSAIAERLKKSWSSKGVQDDHPGYLG